VSARLAALAVLLASPACSRGPAGPAPAPSSTDPSRPLPSPIPDVVARINGQPVHFISIVPLAKTTLDAAPDREKARPTVLRAALDRYIGRELLFQEALTRGLQSDDAMIAKAYNQARLEHPDEQDWDDILRRQGLDQATFRTELRVQATLARLAEEEASKVAPVSDEDAEAYYNSHQDEFRFDQLRVRHILLHVQPTSAPQQVAGLRARAEGLLFRIKRGESLASLAKEFSDDTGSRDKGGELPPFSRGTTDPTFEKAALALKPGEVSGIVTTSAGFHIIEVISRKQGGLPPYEAVGPELKERLMKDRRGEAVNRLEQQLRAKARIETYL
jgi:parvulin-like peptidyl-prolyl isomerase